MPADRHLKALLRDTQKVLEDLTNANHSTIVPSRLHRPTEQNARECPAKICQRATATADRIRDYLKDNA
jgi:hypothetical protein